MTPNIPLLRKVIEHIEAHPEAHRQGVWRCATGMCLAGWTAELSGLRWYCDDPEAETAYLVITDSGQVRSVDTVAAELLGLSLIQAWPLFDTQNSREDLRRIAESIAGEPL